MRRIISVVLALVMALSLVMTGTQTAWAEDDPVADAPEGKVFAGYYTDATYTTPYATATDFPKYVDKDVLTVKFQLILGEGEGAANENSTSTMLRVVTAVDSTNYKAIGMKLEIPGAADRYKESKTVATTITAKAGSGLGAFTTYTPGKTFGTEDAQYFCAFNYTNVQASAFSKGLTFTPYWITKNGTIVYGTPRTIHINQDEYYNNIPVGTADELRSIATRSSSENFQGWTIRLMDDIDLNPGWTASSSEPEQAWTPIGSANGPVFNGRFDGQGHTIRGVYLSASENYKGLFGGTGPAAVIKDFKLKNSYFTSSQMQLASIVGQADGSTFEKIYSDAIVYGQHAYIGGMIGETAGGSGGITMTDCWFAGSVSIHANQNWLGGFIGRVRADSTLENCLCTATEVYNYGTANSSVTSCFVGGLQTSSISVTLSNCVNHTTPYCEKGGSTLGYFVGAQNSGTVALDNCHTVGSSGKYLVGSSNDSGLLTSNGGSCTRQNSINVAGIKALSMSGVKDLFLAAGAKDHWALSANGLPVLSYFAEDAGAQPVNTGWYGDGTATAYTLQDAGDLYGFALLSQSNNFSGKTVKLGADVTTANSGDAANWGSTAPSFGWLPIGDANSKPFVGTFDGQMYTISGIYLKATSNYQGLFGGTDGATVKNFKLKNSYFASTGSDQLGSIVGNARGTFEKIYSEAIVEGSCDRVGGLIGSTAGSGGGITMTDCAFAGSVKINAKKSYLGGLVGNVKVSSTFENCLNTGEVYHTYDGSSGTLYTAGVGGIVGGVTGGTTTITNCVNHSKPEYTSGGSIGLLVGAAGDKTVTLSNSLSILYTNHSGGNLDLVNGVSNPLNCRFTKAQARGDEGYNNFETIRNLFTGAAANHWVVTSDSLPVLSLFAEEYENALYADTSWYGNGTATEYTLMDKNDLYGFAELSQSNNFSGKTVKLGDDITFNKDMDAHPLHWKSIGSESYPFAGTFDGQGHTVSGIYLVTAQQLQGFFGEVLGATIKNFALLDSSFQYTNTTKAAFMGAIAGRASGRFENIYTEADVTSVSSRTGGFIGSTAGTGSLTMVNCWNAGNITGTTSFGGLIGYATVALNITNCLNSGTIASTVATATASGQIGGLVGRSGSKTTISYSLNSGNVIFDSSYITGDYGMIGGQLSTAGNNLSITHSATVTQDGVADYNKTVADVNVTHVTASAITGSAAVGALPDLFDQAEEYWAAVENDTPALTAFLEVAKKHKLTDTSWYSVSSDTYILEDAADLYGFAALSKTMDFAGKTVKLGSDIPINADLDEPDYEWVPISTTELPFAGTFDGDGYTITGVYLSTNSPYAGLFSSIGAEGTVENLRLEDSVFTSSAQYLGSIAGKCMGTLSNIYSEAVVKNDQGRIGGLVGYSSGTAAILEKCWFAGTVCNTATSAESVGQKGGTGGLIGVVDNSSSGALMLRNCLNAGVVDVSAYTGDAIYAGGLIGWVQNQTAVTVESCLMSGSMPKGGSDKLSYGPIAGNVRLDANGVAQSTILISRTYAIDSVESLQGTKVTLDSFEYVSASSITGSAAQTNMPLLGWGTDWKTVEGKLPELDFSNTAAAVSLAASSFDTAALDDLYSSRTLYQGELHDHADTSVGSNAGTSDGYVEITEWYSQMSTKGLDFAASLDHKQASHIDLPVWEESKLIYGSEAGADAIPNKSDPTTKNKHHYSMLFRTKAQFEKVLNAFPGFNYGGNNWYASWEDRGNNGAIEFTYWNPTTRDQFADLIRAVQNAGGFFVLPHAFETSKNNSGLAEDYDFGVDGVGFEVIYDGGTNHSIDDRLYKAWKELLAGDAKMYACAGTDNHHDLDNTCLTSVYGDPDTADADKGYLIDQLRVGDFVAGSAGIKMCVGDKAMGGTTSFSGKRVVVQVDRIHRLANDLSHKYRIDIISEDGVVYSQPLTVNSTTGEVNATFAFDADNSSSFYRVVVMDCTMRTRIAIGNPIWNS